MSLSYNVQNGLLTGTTLGNVTTSQGYSNYGELSSYTANYNSSPLFQTTYRRDSLGRITTLNETELGAAKTLKYSYDAVGRLQNVWRNDTLVSTYGYDANGNRIAHITQSFIDSGTYDAQDRMLSYAGSQYFYGQNGDLQTKISGADTTKYAYDAFGNLTQVMMSNGDVIQYVIDGQNRRMAKKVNGQIVERWIYSGQLSPVAEVDSAGNIVAKFEGGYMIKGGNTYRIITDHLGSVRLVVDINSGSIAEIIDYEEFGNVTDDSNPGFQPFGFAGGLYDPDTKLVRFGARDYCSYLGKWTSKDPIRFGGRSSSLYEYCFSDPINHIDPSGLQVITFRHFVAEYLAIPEPTFIGSRALAGYWVSGAVVIEGSSVTVLVNATPPTNPDIDEKDLQFYGGASLISAGGTPCGKSNLENPGGPGINNSGDIFIGQASIQRPSGLKSAVQITVGYYYFEPWGGKTPPEPETFTLTIPLD